MVHNSERVSHAQALRDIARKCSVSLVPDTASRAAVSGMVADIRTSTGYAAVKKQLEKTFKLYESTFTAAVASASSQLSASVQAVEVAPQSLPKGFRLRGRSFLLTYNRDFLGKPLPDGTPCPGTVDKLWALWLQWKKAKKKELGVVKSSSTLEESLHGDMLGRVHFHWKVDLAEPIDHTTVDAFRFHGVGPDSRTPWLQLREEMTKGARGASYKEVVNRGHFYCWVAKRGALYRGTNWKPFFNYRVNGKWLEDLWADEKIDDALYMQLSLQVKKGHAYRKREFDVVVADQAAARVDQRIRDVNADLAKLRAPFRSFSMVTEWEDSFLTLDFRWKILVLCADSAAGKSNYAESLFENPFILTVESVQNLDLKEFQYEAHDGIILDNVNSWGQLLGWRAVLQARNAKFKGERPVTHLCSL